MSEKIYDSKAAKQKAYRDRVNQAGGITTDSRAGQVVRQKAYRDRVTQAGGISDTARASQVVRQKAYRDRLAQAKVTGEQVTATLRDQLTEARLENMGSRMRRVHDEWVVSGTIPADATTILLDTIKAFIPDELEQFHRADQLKRIIDLFSDMNR